MKTQCPNCKKEYAVAETVAGQNFECQNCKKVYLVPDADASPEGASDAIIWEGHPHLMAYAVPILFSFLLPLLVFGLFFVAFLDRADNLSRLAVVFIITILLGFLLNLVVLITKKQTRYAVMQNIIHIKSGWLDVTEKSIRIADIRSISSSQSVLERFAGIGNINISSSAASEAEIIMLGVNEYKSVIELIENLRK